jgi:hypothetical protein
MSLHHAPTVLERLYACGPLLYLGLMIVNDPAGVIRSVTHLAYTLRTIEQRIKGGPVPRPMPVDTSAGALRLMRAAGALLAICALLPLTGLVN